MKTNIGSHVIIDNSEFRFHGAPAIVVSDEYASTSDIDELKGKTVVKLQVFPKSWMLIPGESDLEFIEMECEPEFLKKDDEHKLEMAQLEKKFGEFHAALFLSEPLDTSLLCFCCYEKCVTRVSVNVWGTICQHDMCAECAKKWDGWRTDGVPPRAEIVVSQSK
ncbi:MAG: hypothetical protein EXS46_03725 [Candidatus Taylorbacteria bacterium]|nr:hypothetical protein [Candidatus Taylorbacteria bacterium]